MDRKVKLDVGVFVHRILRHIRAFKDPDWLQQNRVVLEPREQTLLGVYENEQGSSQDVVVVTDKAIWMSRCGKWDEIRYGDMVSIDWFPEEKRRANSVRVGLKSGGSVLIPIRGEQDGGKDVFEFSKFLSRAMKVE